MEPNEVLAFLWSLSGTGPGPVMTLLRKPGTALSATPTKVAHAM